MNKNEEIEYEEDDSNRVLPYIGQIILAIAILYGTGWDIISGIPQFEFSLAAALIDMKGSSSFLYGGEGFAFLLNVKYYGLVIVDRFFDSSFLSWIGFFIAASMILPFRFFFFSSNG